MKRWALIAAAIAALVGASASVLSTVQHMRIMREGFEQQSFCAISEKINCDVVNASSYSEIFGLPTSWWGLCFYVAIAVLVLFARFSKRDNKGSVATAWFMSVGGLIFSAWLAYVSAFVLGVWCIECMVMYAVNIALFILLFIALGIPVGGIVKFVRDYVAAVFGKPSNLGFSPKIIGNAIAVAAIFVMGCGSFAAAKSGNAKGIDAASLDEKVRAFYMQSLYDIKLDPSWPVWGNPNAPVKIVEFSEFQCPFCRLAAFGVRPYLQEFKNDVAFYFVNFPLDNACNDSIKAPMHQYACLAAKAGVCASARGDFWKFQDELFRKQRELSEETILKLADERGWNRDEFMACINSDDTDKRVKADISHGKANYVTGTPSIFIDGRKVRYWRDPKFIQAVIKQEIKKPNQPPK